jgi:hypothetical protein
LIHPIRPARASPRRNERGFTASGTRKEVHEHDQSASFALPAMLCRRQATECLQIGTEERFRVRISGLRLAISAHIWQGYVMRCEQCASELTANELLRKSDRPAARWIVSKPPKSGLSLVRMLRVANTRKSVENRCNCLLFCAQRLQEVLHGGGMLKKVLSRSHNGSLQLCFGNLLFLARLSATESFARRRAAQKALTNLCLRSHALSSG